MVFNGTDLYLSAWVSGTVWYSGSLTLHETKSMASICSKLMAIDSGFWGMRARVRIPEVHHVQHWQKRMNIHEKLPQELMKYDGLW